MNFLRWTKEIELADGSKASYWVAQSLIVDLNTLSAQVKCEGYFNEQAYENKTPVVTDYYLTIDVTPLGQDGALAAAVIEMAKAKQDLE